MEDIYRIDLTKEEYETLLAKTSNATEENTIRVNHTLKDSVKIIKPSKKKTEAASTATQARTKRAKEKITNAINILRMENKPITAYSIAKESGVSFNTVKKYIGDKKY